MQVQRDVLSSEQQFHRFSSLCLELQGDAGLMALQCEETSFRSIVSEAPPNLLEVLQYPGDLRLPRALVPFSAVISRS
jgi:hypothetical protein